MNICTLFKPVPLSQSHRRGCFRGKNGVGGDAWEGRGGNLPGGQEWKGTGLERWCKGSERDLGMKYAMRIPLLAVAPEGLFQLQRDAPHLLSPRTDSSDLLPPACLGWHSLPGAAGLSPVPGHPLWPQRLPGGGDKVAEGRRHIGQPVGDRCPGLVCSPTPECGHEIIDSLNYLGWERPLKSWSPTVAPALPNPPLTPPSPQMSHPHSF